MSDAGCWFKACGILTSIQHLTSSLSNLVVRPFEVVKPNLVAVGPVLVRLARSAQTYAPARRDHHAAHLAARGRAERGVGEVGLLDRLLAYLALGDARRCVAVGMGVGCGW